MVEALENCSVGRKEMDRDWGRKIPRAEKKHTNCYMWSSSNKEMITMWSGRAENTFFLLPQVLYCNLENHICQVLSTNCLLLVGRTRRASRNIPQAVCKSPWKYKIKTQNLIRSKQRKSSSRSFPSCRRKAVGTCMMEMIAF